MSEAPRDIYGGLDPSDVPAYTVAMVANYVKAPEATVRYWAFGRHPHRPVIRVADRPGRRLSFRNLVEVHALNAIRRSYGVTLPTVRGTVAFLEALVGSKHPLSDLQMFTDGKALFVERFERLMHASEGGQFAIREALDKYLERIERDQVTGGVVRLYPFTRLKPEGPKTIAIDPRVQFGRPCLTGTGIPTEAIIQRFWAGEDPEALAEDIGHPAALVAEAIRYETVQAAA